MKTPLGAYPRSERAPLARTTLPPEGPGPCSPLYRKPVAGRHEAIVASSTRCRRPPSLPRRGVAPVAFRAGADRRHRHACTALQGPLTLNSTPAPAGAISPAGANYMICFLDSEGAPLSGDKNYRVNLPPNIPAKIFWSVTLYDAENSSGLANGQPYRAEILGRGSEFVREEAVAIIYQVRLQSPAERHSSPRRLGRSA